MRFIDLTGKKFSGVEVIRYVGIRSHVSRWLCRCLSCGREFERRATGISNAVGCGCSNTTHGHTRGGNNSLTFRSWTAMVSRCCNKNHADYPHYGGRGIIVCERWRSSFVSFLQDMGERPSKRHSIDRIDTTAGYSPGNCRWATQKEQQRNRIDTRVVEYSGARRTLADWAEIVGIDRYVLHKRIYQHGWTIDRAFSQSVRHVVRSKCLSA